MIGRKRRAAELGGSGHHFVCDDPDDHLLRYERWKDTISWRGDGPLVPVLHRRPVKSIINVA